MCGCGSDWNVSSTQLFELQDQVGDDHILLYKLQNERKGDWVYLTGYITDVTVSTLSDPGYWIGQNSNDDVFSSILCIMKKSDFDIHMEEGTKVTIYGKIESINCNGFVLKSCSLEAKWPQAGQPLLKNAN